LRRIRNRRQRGQIGHVGRINVADVAAKIRLGFGLALDGGKGSRLVVRAAVIERRLEQLIDDLAVAIVDRVTLNVIGDGQLDGLLDGLIGVRLCQVQDALNLPPGELMI
jgi:hypothetical protein